MIEVPIGETKVLLNPSLIQAIQDQGDKVSVYLSFGVMEVDLTYAEICRLIPVNQFLIPSV